jgi:hydroxymethylpyrimidine kinase/phosphomethylpyrimidine kinase
MSKPEGIIALTIAGLDPSGGAGVIADLRAFAAFACRPAAAITSLTFQNDREVFGAEHVSAETVRAQVMAIIDGNEVACAKTGMLPTSEMVREVARLFRNHGLPAPVVDPVMRSTSGYILIEEDAYDALLSNLLPLARLVTPNIPEAEQITGRRIKSVEDMQLAAAAIRALGARAVLIKGGHLGPQVCGPLEAREKTAEVEPLCAHAPDEAPARRMREVPGEVVDLLDEDGQVTVLRGEWIAGVSLRGTGCMLSAAIAAGLGHGLSLEAAVNQARIFVANALRASK